MRGNMCPRVAQPSNVTGKVEMVVSKRYLDEELVSWRIWVNVNFQWRNRVMKVALTYEERMFDG